MPPEQQGTFVSPLGLLITLASGLLLLVLPRRWALLPVVVVACYMTLGQEIEVWSLNFTMLRVLVLFGCARIGIRGEFRKFQRLQIDTLMIWWVISSIVIYTLQWKTPGALINRLGLAYDAFGLYYIFRSLITDLDDALRVFKMFAVVLLPLAICMCVEKSTGIDPFYVLGGVPQYTAIREGVLRCQGPFGHPILAGTFGAAWLPLFGGVWSQKGGSKFLAIVGIASCTVITILSGSSGPLGTYAAGIFGLCMWRMRHKMRAVRWSLVGIMIVLQLVMRAPIWFVLARINIFSGSTGWHRAFVIDRTIANFFDWWLIGTKDPGGWGIWAGDLTNQYVVEGVHGGLITMVLFVWIIVLAFSGVGLAMKAIEDQPRPQQRLLWSIGCALFAHVVTFFTISYFDQNIVNWYLVLATIAAVTAAYVQQPSPAQEEQTQMEAYGVS